MVENHVCPGEFIMGADSHTCTYGALGAFGTGIGCTDFLYAMVTGQSWVLVPDTIRFNLHGKLREGIRQRFNAFYHRNGRSKWMQLQDHGICWRRCS